MIAVDVGNHAYSFGRYFECKPGQAVLMSGYLGSIGFGYPAAMGAWAAARERRTIVAVTGDGGFAPVHGRADDRGQARHEHHARAAQQRPARQDHQGAARGRVGRLADRRCTTPTSPRTPANCGALGIRVTDAAQLDAALAGGLAHDGPALVEVITDPDLV